VKISQPEHGGNGVRSRVVNEWLICAFAHPLIYGLCASIHCVCAVPRSLLVPLSDNLLH